MLCNHGSARDYKGGEKNPAAKLPVLRRETICFFGGNCLWKGTLVGRGSPFARHRCLVVDRSANNVEQLAGDGLLAALVVLQVQLAKQLVGVVGSCLHGHHTCSVL